MPASSAVCPRSSSLREDFGERLARHGRIDAAQRVVGAELDDDDVGLRRHRPFEPRQAVRRRVAGHAGIRHGHVVPARAKRGFELLGKGLAGADAISRRQAVAERDDADRLRAAAPLGTPSVSAAASTAMRGEAAVLNFFMRQPICRALGI